MSEYNKTDLAEDFAKLLFKYRLSVKEGQAFLDSEEPLTTYRLNKKHRTLEMRAQQSAAHFRIHRQFNDGKTLAEIGKISNISAATVGTQKARHQRLIYKRYEKDPASLKQIAIDYELSENEVMNLVDSEHDKFLRDDDTKQPYPRNVFVQCCTCEGIWEDDIAVLESELVRVGIDGNDVAPKFICAGCDLNREGVDVFIAKRQFHIYSANRR